MKKPESTGHETRRKYQGLWLVAARGSIWHLRQRGTGDRVRDACKSSRGNAHAPNVLDRTGRDLDVSIFSRGLPHNYGAGPIAVLDRDGGAGGSAGHGTHALRSQTVAADSGWLFAGVRTGQVDYNRRNGALLRGGAPGTSRAGGHI